MDRLKFGMLVEKAVESLPQEFKDKLENVEIVVEDLPTKRQTIRLNLGHPLQLLGLYEGVPQTGRGTGYTLVLPDKITLFQKSIETKCNYSERRIEIEIGDVVKHEIAHHFGIGDAALKRIEKNKRKKH